jgi:tetratricopeptide (TPR) repeat protein
VSIIALQTIIQKLKLKNIELRGPRKMRLLKRGLVIALLLSSTLVIEPVFAYGEEQGSSERNFVARVIFAEAGPSCSDNERDLVASVMVGRIGHQGFGNGKLKTMYQVASQSGAFSCIGDTKNKNWAKSADPDKLNEAEKSIWDYCYSLAGGNFQQQYGPSGRSIVYYHDKSISKPSSWDNQYWSAVMELETDHFIFYSVLPANAVTTGASGTQQNKMITLTLYIHDGSRDGPTISGAQVTCQDGSGNSFQQTTDSNGYVTITGDPGTWSFAASADGYETNSWNQPITETDTKDAFLQSSIGGINFTSIRLNYIGVNEDSSGNITFDYLYKAQKAEGTSQGIDLKNSKTIGLTAFKTGLAVPDDKFWVNLAPWEPDRIIDEQLRQSEVGRIMLEADLQMKRDVSNYDNPCASETGKALLDLLEKKREALVQQCIDEFPGEIENMDNVRFVPVTRHWIVPDKIYAYTNGTQIYIINATLTISSEPMPEHSIFQVGNQDTATLSKGSLEELNKSAKEYGEYSREIEDRMILPYVIEDVNHGKKYEDLRNVYIALALAQWYKSSVTAHMDIFRDGLNSPNSTLLIALRPWSPNETWEKFVYSFENGEYRCWDNTTTKTTGGNLTRSKLITSGGVNFDSIRKRLVVIDGIPLGFQDQVKEAISDGFLDEGMDVLFGNRLHSDSRQNVPISVSAPIDNATRLDPNLALDWYNRGIALQDRGKFDEAVEAFDEAIRLNPNLALAWSNKGAALVNQGKLDEAIEACDEAIRLDPTYAFPWNNKGTALGMQGKYDEAIKAYDEAIRLDPNNADARSNKEEILNALKRSS